MIRLAVRVARADAEIAAAELLALAPAGLEERDVDADTVELAIYGAPGELPQLPDLRAVVGDRLVDVSTSAVPDDWSDRWRDWHRPLESTVRRACSYRRRGAAPPSAARAAARSASFACRDIALRFLDRAIIHQTNPIYDEFV